MGCGWWILAILVLLLAVGYGYLRILDRLKKKGSSAPGTAAADVKAQ